MRRHWPYSLSWRLSYCCPVSANGQRKWPVIDTDCRPSILWSCRCKPAIDHVTCKQSSSDTITYKVCTYNIGIGMHAPTRPGHHLHRNTTAENSPLPPCRQPRLIPRLPFDMISSSFGASCPAVDSHWTFWPWREIFVLGKHSVCRLLCEMGHLPILASLDRFRARLARNYPLIHCSHVLD